MLTLIRTEPVVAEYYVVVDGVEYQGEEWVGWTFSVDLEGDPHKSWCPEAGVLAMGSGFFDKHFGVKQAAEIRAVCRAAVVSS